MQYAKITNGQCNTSLPTYLILEDGSSIGGFNLLSQEELLNYDWKEFIQDMPNPQEGHHLNFSHYEETDVLIKAMYELVEDEPTVEPVYMPTQEERIQLLESALNDLLMGV